MHRSSSNIIPHPERTIWLWLAPVYFLAAAGAYFIVRYQGWWAETDTATFTRLIRIFIEQGRLAPPRIEVYQNGYAFQTISAYLVALTGLEVAQLQQLIYPLTAALVALPLWLLYRELTGSDKVATIGTMLLCIQPEFLFVILRSSHEKFTRTLMILCLYCLVRSFALRNNGYAFAVHVGFFYLAAFGLITSNNLFAHSFIFGIAVVLILGWMLRGHGRGNPPDVNHLLQRCLYATAICLGLVYLFTFYAYAPAKSHLLLLQNIWDQVAALFLDVQTRPTNAYAQVASAWVNLPVYFLVSIANWIILAASFVLWARQGWRWLVHKSPPPHWNALFVWLFYTAFAIQGAISVLADASGALSSNLQHRIFPTFVMIAVVPVAQALAEWRPARGSSLAPVGITVGLSVIALLSIFKATNEPLLSNRWNFYRPSEVAAIRWGDGHLRYDDVWLEFDERLSVALATEQRDMAAILERLQSPNGNRFAGGPPREESRVLLASTISRLRGARLEQPLPIPADATRLYDNGEAQLFRLRPETAYQR